MSFSWGHSVFCILGRFLEDEYSDYCVPSNVSSGLGSLPLSYVWYKGKENRSWPTDPMLPSGEKLNGSYSYSLIMPYFTTNDMKPADVHELGKKQLSKLYPMVSQKPTCTINHVAMGQVWFLLYTWFIFFYFFHSSGDQTQTSTQPNSQWDFKSPNLGCLLIHILILLYYSYLSCPYILGRKFQVKIITSIRISQWLTDGAIEDFKMRTSAIRGLNGLCVVVVRCRLIRLFCV